MLFVAHSLIYLLACLYRLLCLESPGSEKEMSNNTLSGQATGAEAGAGFGTSRLQPSDWLQDLNIAITAMGPPLALVFVSLRIFVRAQLRTFGWGEHIHTHC